MASQVTDRYGFPLLGLSTEDAASRGACAAREAKTAEKKWVQKPSTLERFTQSGGTLPKADKLLVREGGIPQPLRAALWLRLSGGLAKSQQLPAGIYAELEDEARLTSSVPAADMLRALGTGHPVLASYKATAVLRRMTTGVYYLSQGSVGAECSQSVLRLGAFLLAVLGVENEEAAFWVLFALIEDVVPSMMQEVGGESLEQRVLEALARKRCPKLMAALKGRDLPLSELTASWFPTLFTMALPPETAVRVWDCLFVEGPKVIFRVALALLKMNEASILANPLGLQTGRTLKWRVARMYNVDALFKMAFYGIGTLSSANIAQERSLLEGQMSEALAQQRLRLEAVLTSPRSFQWSGSSSPVNTPPDRSSVMESSSEISSSESEFLV